MQESCTRSIISRFIVRSPGAVPSGFCALVILSKRPVIGCDVWITEEEKSAQTCGRFGHRISINGTSDLSRSPHFLCVQEQEPAELASSCCCRARERKSPGTSPGGQGSRPGTRSAAAEGNTRSQASCFALSAPSRGMHVLLRYRLLHPLDDAPQIVVRLLPGPPWMPPSPSGPR